jgi:hypothetical protein
MVCINVFYSETFLYQSLMGKNVHNIVHNIEGFVR